MASLTRVSALASAVAITLLVAGCTSSESSPAPAGGASSSASALSRPTDLAEGEVAPIGRPEEVVGDLDAPWSVVLTDDGTALISERDSARILELTSDGSTREVGSIPGVTPGGEAGLLGLAVHDGDLFVYSTADSGNRIQRFPLNGGPGSYSLGSATTILDGMPSNSFHNGGRIAFGPDGMLYATVGDAGSGSEAQDRSSLNGKILRMTPEGRVPDDNPFRGSLVYSMGHRNVQGLGWASDGTMFAAEFGENTWDELNIIRPGANYGWPEVEGTGGEDQGFVDPVQEWATDDASPSGLAIVDDTIFIANLRGEVLRGVPVSDPSTSHEYFAGTFGRLRTALASPDGGLWILTNNTDSRGEPRDGDDRLIAVDLS